MRTVRKSTFSFVLLMLLGVCVVPAQAAVVTIAPASPSVGNCSPFGMGGGGSSLPWTPYAAFIYRNVPAFNLQVGDTLAFDLGAMNNVPIQLEIALAATTVNGGTVEAGAFTTVVLNTQTPANPLGDTIIGNFELQFTAQAAFNFPGGGLIIRFSNPSTAYAADNTCNQVMVYATSADASGYFVERVYRDADGVFPWASVDFNWIGAFQVLSAAPTMSCVPPPSGMVAWYPLDEQAGAAAINDIAPKPSSTVNNVGTPRTANNTPTSIVATPGPPSSAGPASVVGQVGGALYFYGPYVEVAPSSELDFSTGDFTVDAGVTAFSIDAWVRIVQVGLPLIQPIVDKFNSPGGPGFAFYIRNQRLELNMNGSTFVSTGPLIAFADPLANTGPWVHVAVTVQGGGRGGQGVFYIDGVQAGTFTPSAGTVNNALPLWIGETRREPDRQRGQIALDELEIFNRALPQSDIQAIYNAGSAGKCKPFVDLGITPSNPITNPLSVTYAVNGCFTRETFLVLNAPLMGIPWAYLDTSGAWVPLPTPLSLITPWMSSGPADGLYALFSGSVPLGGPYDLYLGCDFVPNGHLDIDADLNVNGVYDSLLNVTVE